MAAFCREVKLDAFPALDGLRVFASELAALEWALVEVLHAEMAPPLEIAALQAMPPEAWATRALRQERRAPSAPLRVPRQRRFIANRIDEIVPELPCSLAQRRRCLP